MTIWYTLKKKNNLRNFAKSTGKHLCQSLFLNKVAGLRSFSKNASSRLLLNSRNILLHIPTRNSKNILLRIIYSVQLGSTRYTQPYRVVLGTRTPLGSSQCDLVSPTSVTENLFYFGVVKNNWRQRFYSQRCLSNMKGI